MGIVRVETGAAEPISVIALDTLGAPLTGLTDVKMKIRRVSDSFAYDWSDLTFKTAGSVTTLLLALTEVDATNFPGEYQGTFDTSVITNAALDDTYFITVVQDPGTSVVNFPLQGEVKSGQHVDDTVLTRKIFTNKLDLADGDTSNWILKDDDSATDLLTWDVSDKDGDPILIQPGAPVKRTKGV